MEAMTQEFMLHRGPHVEIWSARDGSEVNHMLTKNNQELWSLDLLDLQSQVLNNRRLLNPHCKDCL